MKKMHVTNLRRRNLLLVIFLCIINFSLTWAQYTVSGVVEDQSSERVVGAEVLLVGTELSAYTNALGKFTLFEVPTGNYTLQVTTDDNREVQMIVNVVDNDLDLGTIEVTGVSEEIVETDVAIITVSDLEAGSDNDDQLFSSVLASGRDVFENAASYNLFAGRFRARGYNNERSHLYINGMYMNDLDDGRVLWNAWGGLNDVMRNRNSTLSLDASGIGYGGIGGSAEINVRASAQRPGTTVRYTHSNRSYTQRTAVTHNSGETKSGWSYSLSAARRWGNEGFIEGTFYDAYSYFLSVEKEVNSDHRLNLTVMGAPLKRGRSGGSFQEMYDLADNNYYNPYWGFQNGEKRNARVYNIHEPIAILNHDWQIRPSTSLKTSIGYQTGRYGSTALDWYLAPDPRPDYYRKLPSFQNSEAGRQQVESFYRENEFARQIQWDRFYEINRNKRATINDVGGIEGNDLTGALSSYIVEEQRFDNTKLSLNSMLESSISPSLSLTAGLQHIQEKVENFKVLNDLLGGEFYVDYDEFALRDFPGNQDVVQNDLNNRNRVIYEGDKFGYNYDINTSRSAVWSQLEYTGSRVDVFGAIELSRDGFNRTGYYRNGRFPDNSFGDSETQNFTNYAVKGGLTYKIDGRNYLYGNATIRTKAPFSRFAYLSARTRDDLVDGLTTEKIFGAEGGYIMRFPGLKGRVTGFYTTFKDQIDNISFYHDELRTFVNYVMSGIDTRHMGMELGIEAKITSQWELEGALALGDYRYTSRPRASITQDNDASVIEENRSVYIKNYYVPSTPQNAGTLGLTYNSTKFWFASINANYFGKNYLDFNPDRRTALAVDLVSKQEQPELWNDIIEQEKLDDNFTIDFFGGKSWRFDDYYLAVNLSVNNILNNTDFITGGFEQYRFDYEGKDTSRFPPRYFYAFGRNYSANISLRF